MSREARRHQPQRDKIRVIRVIRGFRVSCGFRAYPYSWIPTSRNIDPGVGVISPLRDRFSPNSTRIRKFPRFRCLPV
jgi:hypothetical protein